MVSHKNSALLWQGLVQGILLQCDVNIPDAFPPSHLQPCMCDEDSNSYLRYHENSTVVAVEYKFWML